jgi:hypothetical protein
MLREMARETKSPRPLCRKQEFYYASRLGEVIKALNLDQCEGIGYITPGGVGYATRVCLFVLFFLQYTGFLPVTGKQGGYTPL